VKFVFVMRVLLYIAAGFLPLVAVIIADVSGGDPLLIDLLIMFVAISLITISKDPRKRMTRK